MERTQLLRGDIQSWGGNSNQPEQETCFGGVHSTEMTYPFLGLPGSTAACVTSREATARMKSLEDCGAVSRRLREGWVCNCRDEDWLPSAISCSSLSCTRQLRYHRSVLTSQQHLEDFVHERRSATWLAMTQGDVPWYLLPSAISCNSLSCTQQLHLH